MISEIRRLPKAQRKAVGTMLDRCIAAFGNPHEHKGIGLRPLEQGFFECRLNRATRFVFHVEPGNLYFDLMGDHDAVRTFLKNI